MPGDGTLGWKSTAVTDVGLERRLVVVVEREHRRRVVGLRVAAARQDADRAGRRSGSRSSPCSRRARRDGERAGAAQLADAQLGVDGRVDRAGELDGIVLARQRRGELRRLLGVGERADVGELQARGVLPDDAVGGVERLAGALGHGQPRAVLEPQHAVLLVAGRIVQVAHPTEEALRSSSASTGSRSTRYGASCGTAGARPAQIRNPPAPARSTSSRRSRDLPMPGGPDRTSVRPRPARAACSASRSRRSSAPRPTSGPAGAGPAGARPPVAGAGRSRRDATGAWRPRTRRRRSGP